MPHCELFLYENVLEANWRPTNLNKIIIFGNEFNLYKKQNKGFLYYLMAKKIQSVLESDHMLYEMPLPRTCMDTERVYLDCVYKNAFDGLSWHLFDWDGSLHSFNRGRFYRKSVVSWKLMWSLITCS